MKKSSTSLGITLATVFVLGIAATTESTAQTYTDLYNFDYVHGAFPSLPGVLAQGRDGNLYGTTPGGGKGSSKECDHLTDGCGVVFQITPSGTLTVLYSLRGGIHGYFADSGLTLGADGEFYGSTVKGGLYDQGTIFRFVPHSFGATLHSFTGGPQGNYPTAPPIQGNDRRFYGTTNPNPESGIAYRITSSGVFTALATLAGPSFGPLLQATDGNFYGTTSGYGNSNCGDDECGTVFKMSPEGGVTIVHSFSGSDGLYPTSAVIQDDAGNLYGTTEDGGKYSGVDYELGGGVVFRLSRQGVFTVLHNFGDPRYPDDGITPSAGLLLATDGNLYGVTYYGGSSDSGVIFRITADGAYSVLYSFNGIDGENPLSTPMQHTSGKIYGMTSLGGSSRDGVVYSLDLGLGPFVRLEEAAGKIGETGGILGQGLTGTTSVMLNGLVANFTVVSDTLIRATVPAGATTGYVTVTTPTGVLTSNVPFRVIQ